MPHIKLKSGRTYHDIDSTIASLFVEAGLAEYFTPVQLGSKPAPRPTVPVFFVGINPERNRFELVCTLPSGAVQRFDGAPHLAKNAFKCLAWDRDAQGQILQGPEPSEAVLKEYATGYARPAAEAMAYNVSKQVAEEMQQRANDKALRAANAGQ